jgi:hypothetical protein
LERLKQYYLNLKVTDKKQNEIFWNSEKREQEMSKQSWIKVLNIRHSY